MLLQLSITALIASIMAPPADPVDTVTVTVIGDVMMHKKQLEYDHAAFLSDLVPIMSEADLGIANAEFTLAGKPYTGYPCFSAPDSYRQSILDTGVDVLLTANNHILDKGVRGLERTLKQYSLFSGSGLDETQYLQNNPLIIKKKSLRIAIVNFTYGTNAAPRAGYPRVSRMEKDEIARQMQVARDSADFILVLPHWGKEYALRHDRTQEDWAVWLVEEGADAIIGAHPHVVQDTAHIKGVPVVYSMGNAVSNMSARNTQLELAVTLTIIRNRESGSMELKEPELHFLWCSRPGGKTDTFKTLVVADWIGKRDEWTSPSDYDNMTLTLERVKKATGIE